MRKSNLPPFIILTVACAAAPVGGCGKSTDPEHADSSGTSGGSSGPFQYGAYGTHRTMEDARAQRKAQEEAQKAAQEAAQESAETADH